MSEERVPKLIWRIVLPVYKGKRSVKIELFGAEGWRYNYRPQARNIWPRPSLARPERYWEDMYRLRVDGVWWRRGEVAKYGFFSFEEACLVYSCLSQEVIDWVAGMG